MKPLFRRMAVLGLGLLGGSVAGAARARGVVGHVVGHARKTAPLEWALAQGLVDSVVDRRGGPAEAVRGADLVVLATPVGSMASVLEAAAPGLAASAGSLPGGVLVTDVGSVKAPLSDTLPGLLPPGSSFIGSHPMAGSHETGVEHARADLLEGSCCIVTPRPGDDPASIERLSAFWQALGARVVLRAPEAHDAEVAWVSHLPHVVAFAYARALRSAPTAAGELAGSGFRDFVRIARSDSELWGEILGLNQKALAGPLRAFSQALDDLARALEAGDPAGVAERDELLESARRRLDLVSPLFPGPDAAGPEESLAPRRVAAQTCAPNPDHDARSGGEIPEIQAARNGAATRSVNQNS